MKVFVTGASGFIGSAVVKELLDAGHEVLGLARSAESAQMVEEAGATVLRGALEDLDILKEGATQCDGVIHTAFSHDFTQFDKSAAADKAAIEAMGNALKGTDKPIVVTGGTLGLPLIDGWITEDSVAAKESPRFSESAMMSLAEAGVHASIVRLAPSVHGTYDGGFRAGFGLIIVETAKQKGFAAYVGDGSNRWSAVHRLDAARLFRLALQKSAVGARYNAAGDAGITMRELAQLTGEKLDLPVKSISPEEAKEYYSWMSYFISFESAVKIDKTREQLGWEPIHPGLLEDLRKNYF